MTGSSSWKQIAYICAIFVVGAVTGAMIATTVSRSVALPAPHPPAFGDRLRSHLSSRLELTSAQLQKIQPLLDKTNAGMKSVYDESSKKAATVMDEFYAALSAELTPAQKQKLEEMQKERHHFAPGGPPHHRRPHPEGEGAGAPGRGPGERRGGPAPSPNPPSNATPNPPANEKPASAAPSPAPTAPSDS